MEKKPHCPTAREFRPQHAFVLCSPSFVWAQVLRVAVYVYFKRALVASLRMEASPRLAPSLSLGGSSHTGFDTPHDVRGCDLCHISQIL